jgi:hypothetical protein
MSDITQLAYGQLQTTELHPTPWASETQVVQSPT